MATIQIIDDDMEVADHLAAIVKQAGHQVEILYSTQDAIHALMEKKPDLLILDVMFPDNPVGGFDLAREIRNTPAIQNLPIILLTSVNQEFPMNFSSSDIDDEWMPVQEFIEKPARASQLLRAIDKMLRA